MHQAPDARICGQVRSHVGHARTYSHDITMTHYQCSDRPRMHQERRIVFVLFLLSSAFFFLLHVSLAITQTLTHHNHHTQHRLAILPEGQTSSVGRATSYRKASRPATRKENGQTVPPPIPPRSQSRTIDTDCFWMRPFMENVSSCHHFALYLPFIPSFPVITAPSPSLPRGLSGSSPRRL